MFTIKDVALIMDMSPYTLRFYDKKGLFPFVKRNNNNVRTFDEEDLEWVYVVKCLRDTGLSIAKVKKYIDLCTQGEDTVSDRLILLNNQKEIIKGKLIETNDMLEMIEYKISSYENYINEESEVLFNPFREKKENKLRNMEMGSKINGK